MYQSEIMVVAVVGGTIGFLIIANIVVVCILIYASRSGKEDGRDQIWDRGRTNDPRKLSQGMDGVLGDAHQHTLRTNVANDQHHQRTVLHRRKGNHPMDDQSDNSTQNDIHHRTSIDYYHRENNTRPAFQEQKQQRVENLKLPPFYNSDNENVPPYSTSLTIGPEAEVAYSSILPNNNDSEESVTTVQHQPRQVLSTSLSENPESAIYPTGASHPSKISNNENSDSDQEEIQGLNSPRTLPKTKISNNRELGEEIHFGKAAILPTHVSTDRSRIIDSKTIRPISKEIRELVRHNGIKPTCPMKLVTFNYSQFGDASKWRDGETNDNENNNKFVLQDLLSTSTNQGKYSPVTNLPRVFPVASLQQMNKMSECTSSERQTTTSTIQDNSNIDNHKRKSDMTGLGHGINGKKPLDITQSESSEYSPPVWYEYNLENSSHFTDTNHNDYIDNIPNRASHGLSTVVDRPGKTSSLVPNSFSENNLNTTTRPQNLQNQTISSDITRTTTFTNAGKRSDKNFYSNEEIRFLSAYSEHSLDHDDEDTPDDVTTRSTNQISTRFNHHLHYNPSYSSIQSRLATPSTKIISNHAHKPSKILIHTPGSNALTRQTGSRQRITMTDTNRTTIPYLSPLGLGTNPTPLYTLSEEDLKTYHDTSIPTIDELVHNDMAEKQSRNRNIIFSSYAHVNRPPTSRHSTSKKHNIQAVKSTSGAPQTSNPNSESQTTKMKLKHASSSNNGNRLRDTNPHTPHHTDILTEKSSETPTLVKNNDVIIDFHTGISDRYHSISLQRQSSLSIKQIQSRVFKSSMRSHVTDNGNNKSEDADNGFDNNETLDSTNGRADNEKNRFYNGMDNTMSDQHEITYHQNTYKAAQTEVGIQSGKRQSSNKSRQGYYNWTLTIQHTPRSTVSSSKDADSVSSFALSDFDFGESDVDDARFDVIDDNPTIPNRDKKHEKHGAENDVDTIKDVQL